MGVAIQARKHATVQPLEEVRMTRFANINADLARTPAEPGAGEPASEGGKKRHARDGKKGIVWHFSPELSKALNMIAVEEGRTVQALMGEAFDMLLRSRGKHPFDER